MSKKNSTKGKLYMIRNTNTGHFVSGKGRYANETKNGKLWTHGTLLLHLNLYKSYPAKDLGDPESWASLPESLEIVEVEIRVKEETARNAKRYMLARHRCPDCGFSAKAHTEDGRCLYAPNAVNPKQ